MFAKDEMFVGTIKKFLIFAPIRKVEISALKFYVPFERKTSNQFWTGPKARLFEWKSKDCKSWNIATQW